MEVLAALGFGAKELFNYNRENYKFDQEQRLERETWRLEMQVKRFELFREDVRDLVELTVDRMDVYHLVGAMFLDFCIVLFCYGRVQGESSAPHFLLSLFMLSTGCAFIYLLLAVWLSMHASIAAHSAGVRLLTRFVRLPIPSLKQLSNLTYQLQDYEKQNVANVLRLPFLDRRGKAASWQKSGRVDPAQSASGGASSSTAAAPGEHLPTQKTRAEQENYLPEQFETPMGGEDLLQSANGALPERHIQLFRRLQTRWQCYDAFCRVCMGLGVNQILQGLSYYAICHTLVENRSPTTGFLLIMCFQATTVAIAVLDLAGIKGKEIILIQVVGMLPCIITALELAFAKRNKHSVLDHNNNYWGGPFAFFFQALWFQLWLNISRPNEGNELPKRFRQVLFLDVFGDAGSWKPTEDEDDGTMGALNALDDEEGNRQAVAVAAKEAVSQLKLAQSAMRRWAQVPPWAVSATQRDQLDKFTRRLIASGDQIDQELVTCEEFLAGSVELDVFERRLRPFQELQPAELINEAFRSTLLGPFKHPGDEDSTGFHWDVENERCLFADTPLSECEGAFVLELSVVDKVLSDLEKAEMQVLELRITRDADRADQHLAPTRPSSRRRAYARKYGDLRPGEPERPGERWFPNLPEMLCGWRRRRAKAADNNMPKEYKEGLIDRRQSSTTVASRASIVRRRRSMAASDDPTIKAIAGDHERHFVPEQLPWQIVNGLTRVLQICWLVCSVTDGLQLVGIGRWDFQRMQTDDPVLVSSPHFALTRQPIDWDRHQPLAMAFDAASEELVVLSTLNVILRARRKKTSVPVETDAGHTAGHTYLLDDVQDRVADSGGARPSPAIMCGLRPSGADRSGCWIAQVASEKGGSKSWKLSVHGFGPGSQGQSLTLRAKNFARPKVMAGAFVKCSLVTHLAGIDGSTGTTPAASSADRSVPGDGGGSAANESDHGAGRRLQSGGDALDGDQLCLVFAGWDGKHLHVGASHAHTDGQLVPSFDVPVDRLWKHPKELQQKNRTVVRAMHIEPESGRLWVLVEQAEIKGIAEVWDLFNERSLGAWRPDWEKISDEVDFLPAALCDAGRLGIFFAGEGGPANPQASLVWTRQPYENLALQPIAGARV